MIHNRDASNRWHQNYFGVFVRTFAGDATRFDEHEGSRGAEYNYTDSRFQTHQIETELSIELGELWQEVYNTNSLQLKQKFTFTVPSGSRFVALDPPSGKLPIAFRTIHKVFLGGYEVKLYALPTIFSKAGYRWGMDGRNLIFLDGSGTTTVSDSEIEVEFTPEPSPINLGSPLPYYGLPPSLHPTLAMGASCRLMSAEDPEFQKKFATYKRSRQLALSSIRSTISGARVVEDDGDHVLDNLI